MLETAFILLLAYWLVGVLTSYTFGGFIHVLLVLAFGVMLLRIAQGRRSVHTLHSGRSQFNR